MRLIALKLEGFKSFADPVRWTLGEPLPDALFNGGNSRAPADWRAVEK